MNRDQQADLVFVHVIATKFQESLDNVELNKQVNKQLMKFHLKGLQKELEKVINILYKDINEEEEQQLRDLSRYLDLGLHRFRKSLKN